MAAASYFDRAYFDWQGARAEESARAVVPLLLELVSVTSAVDLGCGSGAWLQVLADHGAADVVGIDGAYLDRSQLRIPVDRFVPADLEEPPPLGRTFDLALSLEAAHYAPERSAPAIVAALTAYAPVVYFAAAVPHQQGGPGLNRQWPSYWADLFAEHGYGCADVLRPRLWEDGRVDWWYAQNGLLFLREGAPGPAPTGRPLPLVHPGLLDDVAARAEAPADDGSILRRLVRRR